MKQKVNDEIQKLKMIKKNNDRERNKEKMVG
jgi:hypothetical protein